MANNLIWIGLICCVTALGLQLFPDAAFRIGADENAGWLVFGFGMFLIVVAAIMNSGAGRGVK